MTFCSSGLYCLLFADFHLLFAFCLFGFINYLFRWDFHASCGFITWVWQSNSWFLYYCFGPSQNLPIALGHGFSWKSHLVLPFWTLIAKTLEFSLGPLDFLWFPLGQICISILRFSFLESFFGSFLNSGFTRKFQSLAKNLSISLRLLWSALTKLGFDFHRSISSTRISFFFDSRNDFSNNSYPMQDLHFHCSISITQISFWIPR